MKSKTPYVGIECGAGAFGVARFKPRTDQPESICNADGDENTPSVVWFGDNGEVLIGSAAERRMADGDRWAVRFALGEIASRRILPLPGKRITPSDLCVEILRKLKRDAEEFLNNEVSRCVVTCPAAADQLERDRIQEAASKAGFAEVETMEEPEAAVLAYSHMGCNLGDKILVMLVREPSERSVGLVLVGRGLDDDTFTLLKAPRFLRRDIRDDEVDAIAKELIADSKADTIVRVGNGSHVSEIERRLCEALHLSKPYSWVDDAVALGAAIQAHRLWGVNVSAAAGAPPRPDRLRTDPVRIATRLAASQSLDVETVRLKYRATLDRAKLMMSLQRFDDAIQALDTALHLVPGDSSAVDLINRAQTARDCKAAIEHGQSAMRARRFDDAVREFETAIRLDSRDSAAVAGLRDARNARDAAVAEIALAAARRRAEHQIALDSGRSAMGLRRFDEALRFFGEALRAVPDDPLAFALLGDARSARQTEIAEAERAAQVKRETEEAEARRRQESFERMQVASQTAARRILNLASGGLRALDGVRPQVVAAIRSTAHAARGLASNRVACISVLGGLIVWTVDLCAGHAAAVGILAASVAAATPGVFRMRVLADAPIPDHPVGSTVLVCAGGLVMGFGAHALDVLSGSAGGSAFVLWIGLFVVPSAVLLEVSGLKPVVHRATAGLVVGGVGGTAGAFLGWPFTGILAGMAACAFWAGPFQCDTWHRPAVDGGANSR